MLPRPHEIGVRFAELEGDRQAAGRSDHADQPTAGHGRADVHLIDSVALFAGRPHDHPAHRRAHDGAGHLDVEFAEARPSITKLDGGDTAAVAFTAFQGRLKALLRRRDGHLLTSLLLDQSFIFAARHQAAIEQALGLLQLVLGIARSSVA